MEPHERYGTSLTASIQAWVENEYPEDPALAERAAGLALALAAHEVGLSELCRTVYAYVVDNVGAPPPAERPSLTTGR